MFEEAPSGHFRGAAQRSDGEISDNVYGCADGTTIKSIKRLWDESLFMHLSAALLKYQQAEFHQIWWKCISDLAFKLGTVTHVSKDLKHKVISNNSVSN